MFQSTPVIADERMRLRGVELSASMRFQSTPVIADERMIRDAGALVALDDVSIHARHC